MVGAKWEYIRQEWSENLHRVIEGDDPMQKDLYAGKYEAICFDLNNDKGETVVSVAA